MQNKSFKLKVIDQNMSARTPACTFFSDKTTKISDLSAFILYPFISGMQRPHNWMLIILSHSSMFLYNARRKAYKLS